jgi:hypothetical protein
LTSLDRTERFQGNWHEPLEVIEAVRRRAQNKQGDLPGAKILLIRKVLVNGDYDFKTRSFGGE